MPVRKRVRDVMLLAGIVSLLGCRPGSDDNSQQDITATARLQVELAPVKMQEITRTLELVGNFIPLRRTTIVAEVDGVIEKIPAPQRNVIEVESAGQREVLPLGIGAEVRHGELLVKLNSSDYERALDVAEADLNSAQRNLEHLQAWRRPEELRKLKALVQEAEANWTYKKNEFDRVQRLRQNNAVSDSERDEKQSEMRRAFALLANATAQLEIAEAGPTKEEVAVAEAAVAAAKAKVERDRWKVEKTLIVAPYDAVVTERYVDLGDRVTALPRVEILEIMDVRMMVAEVGVPERFSDKVLLRDQVAVRVEGTPEDLQGSIIRINGKVDAGSRTFRVRAAVDNSERRYRVGQFVRVRFRMATSPDTLTIPRRAVTYAGGQPRVFLCDGERVHATAVNLGIQTEEDVEVLDGLSAGDEVVVRDPAVLSDGMAVQVQPATSVAHLDRSQH